MQGIRAPFESVQAAAATDSLPPPVLPETLAGVSTILVVEDEPGIALLEA